MRTWAKGSAPAAFLAAGVMALGSGTAHADTGGDGSIGGGNQLNLPITVPIDISGNAVAIAGDADASSKGGASVQGGNGGGISGRTSGAHSILGGNQVNAPITAPINACGNAVAIFGNADAGCKGGATVKNSGSGGAGHNVTSGRSSILGGNQIVAPITAPINACGNSVAIFGNATAGCKGGASVQGSRRGGAGHNVTSGRSSILGGNQIIAPVTAPINVCGNSVAVLGRSFSGCKGGASVSGGGHGHGGYGGWKGGGHGGWKGGWKGGSKGSGGRNVTDGRSSIGGGNQVVAPITAPVNVCGNAIGNGSASCGGGASVKHPTPGGWSGRNVTDGRSSIGGGNQVVAPITLPINICGNAVALLGDAFGGCKGGASVKGAWWARSGSGHNVTSGRSSILGGNQVVAPITAPVNLCGNAVAVLGRSNANCAGGASVLGGVGGGHNTTSGRYGILAGNQIVAPITAPVNVCGNAVAVLGDAAAGCLGGAQVGSQHGRYDRHAWGRPQHQAAARDGMSALPAVPALSGLKEANGVQQMSAAATPSAPAVGDLPSMTGLPALPGAPEALPSGSLDKTARTLTGKNTVSGVTDALPTSDLDETTDALPLKNLGLMSAEQPVGVTGMNSGSLAALLLGAMFAASASLFAVTRRVRVGRK
ncbi:chaplin family protein [Planotetraspora kaengkrachanensis]|uniref:Chaplin domain-containing protein n=1 Tax=Planotetraspora kaengkrachanensis TaxID=575193 RepID=A0A8J3Q105_9ACTN|nr:chaplin family protein [Planotetraspora kaengkrachanensis]GIG84603.1 hypothetical protein Pka01_77300 [Planotetraspora kaengkrachanensis]